MTTTPTELLTQAKAILDRASKAANAYGIIAREVDGQGYSDVIARVRALVELRTQLVERLGVSVDRVVGTARNAVQAAEAYRGHLEQIQQALGVCQSFSVLPAIVKEHKDTLDRIRREHDRHLQILEAVKAENEQLRAAAPPTGGAGHYDDVLQAMYK